MLIIKSVSISYYSLAIIWDPVSHIWCLLPYFITNRAKLARWDDAHFPFFSGSNLGYLDRSTVLKVDR